MHSERGYVEGRNVAIDDLVRKVCRLFGIMRWSGYLRPPRALVWNSQLMLDSVKCGTQPIFDLA
jgi:hypothetical protein